MNNDTVKIKVAKSRGQTIRKTQFLTSHFSRKYPDDSTRTS